MHTAPQIQIDISATVFHGILVTGTFYFTGLRSRLGTATTNLRQELIEVGIGKC